MKIRFCYDWAGEVDVPDSQLIGVYEPKTAAGACDEDTAVAAELFPVVG